MTRMNEVQRLRVAVVGLLVAVALLLVLHIWDAARLAGLESSLRSIVLEKQAAADRAERCGKELRDLRRAEKEHEILDEQREALWPFSQAPGRLRPAASGPQSAVAGGVAPRTPPGRGFQGLGPLPTVL